MTDLEQAQGPSESRSILTCLGIGCAVVFVLALIASIAGYLLQDRIRDSMVDGVYEGMEREIKASDLDSKEKTEVLTQVNRLRTGIKADEVTMDEFMKLMQRVGEGPLSAVFLSTTLRAGLQDPSFTEAERASAEDALRRYIAGRVEGTFTRADDRELARAAGLDQEGEGFQVRIETDQRPEQTRKGVELIQAKVSEAGIPPVEESPDISGVLEGLIDPVLD